MKQTHIPTSLTNEEIRQFHSWMESNPVDIINHNLEKISMLQELLTNEGNSANLQFIQSGLCFTLQDIEDQLKFAVHMIEQQS